MNQSNTQARRASEWISALCRVGIHLLARFDVVLALVERPKGAGICLAQAEGLGNLWKYALGPKVRPFVEGLDKSPDRWLYNTKGFNSPGLQPGLNKSNRKSGRAPILGWIYLGKSPARWAKVAE